jgi:hypothetical protein
MRLAPVTWIAVCAIAGALGTQNVHAQIVKCKSSSGQVNYTQGRCPAGTEPMDLPAGVAADAVGTSAGSSDPPPLTGRAAELQSLSDSCPLDIGSELTMRATVQVTRRADSNHYIVSGLRDLEFDTVDRAASAGCAAKTAEYMKKSGGRVASGPAPREPVAPTPAQNTDAARVLGRFLGPRPGVMNVYALEDGRGLRDYREATDYKEGRSVTVKTAVHKPTGDSDPFRPTRIKGSYEYTLEVRRNQLLLKVTDNPPIAILQAPVSEYGLRLLSPKATKVDNGKAGYTGMDVVCTVKKPVRQKVLDTMRNTVSSVCETELGGGARQTISYLFAEEVGLVEEVFQLHPGPNVSGGEEPVRTVLLAVNTVSP